MLTEKWVARRKRLKTAPSCRNIFDWLCYVLLIICTITHLVDIFKHSPTVARLHVRFMAVTIIAIWIRLMKNIRAYSLLGTASFSFSLATESNSHHWSAFIHSYIFYSYSKYALLSILNIGGRKKPNGKLNYQSIFCVLEQRYMLYFLSQTCYR